MPQQTVPPPLDPDFLAEALDDRIHVHEAMQVIELVLTGLYFHRSAEANAFYDRVEERVQETGEPRWFFLVNATGYRVDDAAWFAFTRRGRDMQEAHSMGTVHFDDSDITRAQIARDDAAGTRDPNLFADRDAALARLRSLPSHRMQRIQHDPNHSRDAIRARLRFDAEAGILHIDWSGLSFEHSRDVNDIFGWMQEVVHPTGRKWYLAYNYDGTRIQSPAWVQFSARGAAFAAAHALGSVRYAPGSETEVDIRLRAENRGERPNIRNTLAEALARIDEMKAGG